MSLPKEIAFEIMKLRERFRNEGETTLVKVCSMALEGDVFALEECLCLVRELARYDAEQSGVVWN